MKRSRKLELTLLATAAVAGCSSLSSVQQIEPVPSTGITLQRPSSPSVVDAPPVRLVPQPEGTPLPPRDPRVADHWPPEFKQMIDNLLSLYPKEGKPLSVEEVEKKMGLKLTERILPEGHYPAYKQYSVSGTRYADPGSEQWRDFAANYVIYRAEPPGGMTQSLKLVTSPYRSGFCLDPYELTIYTGSKFLNGDTSPHMKRRYWPGAYVWGMFEWSATGEYIGENFYIAVSRNPSAADRKALGAFCVADISALGRYIKE